MYLVKDFYSIGIDVGGSSLKCGLVDYKGKVIYSFLMPLANIETADDVVTLINAAIRKCINKSANHILGVGIGFPGIVNNNIVIGGADNLPGFINYPLGDVISKSTGLLVVVDNDANMMAWGEKNYGAGRNATDAVFLTIGTGIGGSLIVNNELYGGYQNQGAEMGHVIINFNGKTCSCGSKGCLEAYASTSALIDDYFDLKGEKVNGKRIVESYLSGEEQAEKALNLHFDYLAAGITGFINVFSPQKVIIGGGISEAGEFYINEIRNRVAKLAMPATISNTQIVRAQLGNNAGMLGCVANVFSKLKNQLEHI
ncbi:ROK family protein [Pseudopedobacter saltans DSM 12145]|uniref:ROK family protein n=1 Tax=Pseudopedobacter saltans (strain ATCC 51119 / DSM 12145 / JCM 21818 / CCUG 39354 / LMG 10337 / NBRC 100064 / NCIMB 13643) TaxID=762903 RepID=F0S8A1_PSESL|nr:ROK family protein [Pseudopedobacter saltans]ADY52363.1 ROK family protein [Pseudopedobacter saltans DSM 12145]